jgi:CBS domain-containing protein
MKVSEVMRKAVVIDENIKVKDAAKIMSLKKIGSLIVVKNDKIVGIITERDVMRNISNLKLKVKEVMSQKVITIDSEEEIEIAGKSFAENRIKRIPVMKNQKLVGIITITDAIGHLKNVSSLGEDFLIN